MADISDEALQEEIAVFFTPRVHAYLEKCIKRAQFVGKLFSPSHALNILRAFEAEIVHLPSSEIPQNDYQGTLDLWKKTFTRNILVPKYLLQDPHIDIEHVIQLMQKVLYTACQEVKTETYVLSLKKTIINSVRNVPVLERLKRARQILHSSIKVLGKMEKAFPTEPVLIAFSPAKLEALIRESTAPLPPTQEPLPSETVETYPIKKKVRLSQPLNDFLDRDNLKA
ncbi:MAG: hypothetical protein WCN87_05010, partial [Chlamydiota bacterium]